MGFISGVFVGAFLGVVLMAILQINRIDED